MAVVQGLRFFQLDQKRKHFELGFKWMYLFTPLLFVILMVGYGFYNYTQFGSPTILSNTIPRVKDLKEISQSSPEGGREAVGALNTRNMLEGFNSFLISNDRGVLFYTPIAFLSILGIGVLAKKNKEKEVLLLTVPLTCLVLYTMFGDPYGGWAFGSRYILAIMPELMILVGLGLAKFAKNIWVKLLYSVVFVYSSAVSLLAPLTTNVIPPYVEARYLNLKSNYLVNIDMLKRNELNSFFFNNVLHKSIPGIVYYILIAVLIASVGLYLIWVRKPVYENAN